jgi:hypothetical protein
MTHYSSIIVGVAHCLRWTVYQRYSHISIHSNVTNLMRDFVRASVTSCSTWRFKYTSSEETALLLVTYTMVCLSALLHLTIAGHVQLKPVRRCSQVKILRRLEKDHHRHQAGHSLMHHDAYPVCREFLELLYRPLYNSLLHFVVRRESEGCLYPS